MTSKKSFNEVEKIHEQIINIKENNVPIIIVANKTDLADQRAVLTEEGQQLADKLGCMFIETSAKNHKNVDLVFENLFATVIKNQIALLGEKKKVIKKKKHGCSIM